MPIAAAKLDTIPRLETVLTFRASRDEIGKLWPRMSPVDEFASPGPARVVSVELSNGPTASVVFHERKQLVEILAAPLEVGIEAGLAGLLFELSISPEALTWTHARIDLQVLLARVKVLTERERDHRKRPISLRPRSPVTAAGAQQRKSIPVDEVEIFDEAKSAAIYRKIRSDIKSSTLERKLGLKSGAIRNPDGSDARSDKRLGTLRKDQRKHK
jgi:hypothetical protein